ncbi:hypothetical protein [Nocardioides sambongensis]|uniref:hypothetical protein n=1 Tax=Nocardioides sambongensis TaxID=2589074 RepID=UPI00112D1A56|nr:hypothetical protein [Nocardioides sambongensis]
MKVRDRWGQTWRVTRRWVPWRRRLKGMWRGPFEMMPAGADDPISLIIFTVIALPLILLAIVASLELLVLLLVFPFAVLIRMLFGRHWVIEARKGFRIWWQDEAGDWRASGEQIRRVVDAIGAGELPPNNVDTEPEEAAASYPPR